jgi:hypothetical protein
MAGDVSSTDRAAMPAAAPVGGAITPFAAEALATARAYAREALAPETLRAYAADWGHFSAWCATAPDISLPHRCGGAIVLSQENIGGRGP